MPSGNRTAPSSTEYAQGNRLIEESVAPFKTGQAGFVLNLRKREIAPSLR